MIKEKNKYVGVAEGVPCGHPGCLSHITHPCEKCGRVGGSFHRMPISTAIKKAVKIFQKVFPNRNKEDIEQFIQIASNQINLHAREMVTVI